MDERKEKVSKLLENSEFLEKLKACQSHEDVQKLFHDYAVDVTVDEVQQMVDESIAAHEADEGELKEDSLKKVNGGVIGWFIASGVMISFYASYGYHYYRRK